MTYVKINTVIICITPINIYRQIYAQDLSLCNVMDKKKRIYVFAVVLIAVSLSCVAILNNKTLNKNYFTGIRFERTGKSSYQPSIDGNEEKILALSKEVGISEPEITDYKADGYRLMQASTYFKTSEGTIRCTGFLILSDNVPKAAWIEAAEINNGVPFSESLRLYPANSTKEDIVKDF